MARRKHIVGTCHICGAHAKLSFEHVPPRAAFNNRPIVQASIEQLIKKERDLDYIAYSAPFRPPIPEQIGHLFRLIPATYSGAFRPL